MIEVEEEQDELDGNATDECVACGEPVAEGEAESTYCGTVHDVCLDEHKRGCRVCDEDGEHHGNEDDDESEDDE